MNRVNKKHIRSLMVAAVLLSGCTKMTSQSKNSGSLSSASVQQQQLPPVGLMSAEQILKSFVSVTGTQGTGLDSTPADDLIVSTYNTRSGSLPSVQTLDQTTGPMLISVTNIASSVCAKAVDSDIATGQAQAGQRLFFREMDFTKGISGQSANAITAGFGRLVRNAWRRDPSSTESATIASFVTDFSSGADMNDTAQTRLLAVSVCTAVLSSTDALTY
jgi:hypothetical protein